MIGTVGDIRVERIETKLRGVERHILLPLFPIDFFLFPYVHKESISYVHSEVKVVLEAKISKFGVRHRRNSLK